MQLQRTPVCAALLALAATTTFDVSAAEVTFGSYDDSHSAGPQDTRELFDIDASIASGNHLDIGIADFNAAGDAMVVALDTLSFLVTAPDGFVITSLTYNEAGQRSIDGSGGATVATGSVVANGMTNDLGLVMGTEPSSSSGWALDTAFDFGSGVDSVMVSITNSLFAAGGGAIAKTLAGVDVSLAAAPVPLPVSFGLLASGVIGACTLGRRRSTDAGRVA